MKDLLMQQYEMVRSSRKVLLNYCSKISESDFMATNSTFGRGSIRNLLAHIGNVYEFWISKNGLKNDAQIREINSIKNINDCDSYFNSIDEIVQNFIEKYSSNYLERLNINLSNREITTTPLQLFTHVITHEFHHKGQILSLSRHLGYTPIDTDIIR